MYNVLIEQKTGGESVSFVNFEDVVKCLKDTYYSSRKAGNIVEFRSNGGYGDPSDDVVYITVSTSIMHDGMELDFILHMSMDWIKTILGMK